MKKIIALSAVAAIATTSFASEDVESKLTAIPEGSPINSVNTSGNPRSITITATNLVGTTVQLYHYHLDSRKPEEYVLINNQQIKLLVVPNEQLIVYRGGGAISEPKYVRVEFNNQTGGYVNVISTSLDGSINKITLKPQDSAISTSYRVGQLLSFQQNGKEIKCS